MEKEIIVDINPYQTRVVLLEDGSPSEIYIEHRGRERLVGNIYKGRVQNVPVSYTHLDVYKRQASMHSINLV